MDLGEGNVSRGSYSFEQASDCAFFFFLKNGPNVTWLNAFMTKGVCVCLCVCVFE